MEVCRDWMRVHVYSDVFRMQNCDGINEYLCRFLKFSEDWNENRQPGRANTGIRILNEKAILRMEHWEFLF